MQVMTAFWRSVEKELSYKEYVLDEIPVLFYVLRQADYTSV